MRYPTEAGRPLVILACFVFALLSSQSAVGEQKTNGTQCDRQELIKTQLKALRNGDPVARVQAADWLGALRAKEAVSVLLNCLDDRDPNLRNRSVDALGAIGDQRAIPLLLRQMENGQWHGDILRALTRIDKNWHKRPDVQARYDQYEARFRLKYLESPAEEPRANQGPLSASDRPDFAELSMMQQFDPERACHFFAELVAEDVVPEPFRSWIYFSLADSPRLDSLPLLIKTLRRFPGDASEAEYVLSAVKKIDPNWRNSPAAENLAPDLIAWTRDHPERIKLDGVILILKAVRDPVAVPVLVNITKEKELSAKARLAAVSALAALPGTQAKAALLELAEQEDPVIGSVFLSEVAGLRDPDYIRILKRGLANKSLDTEARFKAANSLLELDPDSLELLIHLIADNSQAADFREACVLAASGTKDKRMIPILVSLLDSPPFDPLVLVTASEALQAIETVEPLFALLERENAEYAERRIIEGIAKIAGPEGVPRLIRFARGRPEFAPTVGETLPSEVGRKVPERVLDLLAMLDSKDVRRTCRQYQLDSARENLLHILAECPKAEAIPVVEALLKDDSARVRACASYALYKIKAR